jgi:hypothetical protein
MFKKITNLFKEPEKGHVKLSFIALNENDEPDEDVATVPYHEEFIQRDVEAKFRKFMLLKKHLVVEITVLEVTKE